MYRYLFTVAFALTAYGCCPVQREESGTGGTCYVIEETLCIPTPGQCEAAFGPGNADEIVCDGDVEPDGNCLALGKSATCPDVMPVFCCGANQGSTR